ncbi:3-dehydroquinate dehydratase i aroc i [hydrocarbon metagenome]|uniref:3-dehydroquinate dehydratase n=1 Tax=hydrocarbon metagenome TaxID=938273 RepID=A0A0W8FJ59_9ZZZZ|nr:type I 3-dehydroquinate dehydratase [Methanomicrobiaceae archaeon]
MRIVVSVQHPDAVELAIASGADIIELRLDLMKGDLPDIVERIRANTDVPLLATLRSRNEGGRFEGDVDAWLEAIRPLVRFVDMVDVETGFRLHVPSFRDRGVQIVASLHTTGMPTREELEGIDQTLRGFGDIPKIVVQPRTHEDVIELLSFTYSARKPICTSIMGEGFRFARALFPLFGSELAFCHAGTPTAKGQYHVEEFKLLMRMLQ